MANVLADVLTLPVALERALAAFPEDVAARATTALGGILRERLTADDERQWTSSTLTGDGFPVELTFTTADERLRYTAEPVTWQDTPQRRLDAAIHLLHALDVPAIPEETANAWRAAQRFGTLRYGAWLGGRHGAGGDEYKIYVEWPEGNETVSRASRYSRPRLPDRTVTLRMVAHSPTTQRYETYYRIPALAPHHLPRVLAPCGLEAHSPDLLDYLTDAYGHPIRERLPGASVGVSYVTEPDGTPLSVSVFLFARVFWGGDARVRERFGQLARSLGWDDRRYQQITAPLAARHTWSTRHGILGFTLAQDGQLHLSIGVRPPESIETEAAP